MIKASGVDVINGVNYIPNKPFMKAIEGDKDLSNIYNRYAHILFVPGDVDKADFKLERTDKIIIKMRPDSKLLLKQDIRYIVMPVIDMRNTYHFKKKLTTVPLDGFDIYEL
jgi:hypothetical protein